MGLQAGVDKHRRFRFGSVGCAGSTHDSQCFKLTNLSKLLHEGYLPWPYWIAADDAYMNSDFMITPFCFSKKDTEEDRVRKDSFNFHHSNLRITVECAFGMLVRRFGFFWRKMECKLSRLALIVQACMCLHNVCIDGPEWHKETGFATSHSATQIPVGKNGWGKDAKGRSRIPRTRLVVSRDVFTGNQVTTVDSEGFPIVLFTETNTSSRVASMTKNLASS